MSLHAVRPKILGFISEDVSAMRVALLVLLIGGFFTGLLAWSTLNLFHQQLRQRFQLLASERYSRIEERFDDQQQRLDGLRRFFINSDNVDRDEFYASDGIREIYELEPDVLLLNAEAIFTRIHPQDSTRVRASIRASAETLSPWREEYRVQLPQRGVRWVRGEATPEELPGGGVLWHGYISDISDLKRVEEELRALSITDSLTGIHNRRYFQERLTTEMARVERGGGQLSVIMLDIDHFKRINDLHGHAVGDKVLQTVCARIGHRLRRTDVFCRLGGEEFMVLCPDIDGEHARLLALELWQGLRSTPIDDVGIVTASFGIASWRLGEGADALLLRADSGVYAAKQAGRDRVEGEVQ